MRMDLYYKLRKYESYLITASKANYIRGLNNKQIDELISIGDEIDIHYKNNHCPSCLLAFVKKLAKPYFAQQESLKMKEEEKKQKKFLGIF